MTFESHDNADLPSRNFANWNEKQLEETKKLITALLDVHVTSANDIVEGCPYPRYIHTYIYIYIYIGTQNLVSSQKQAPTESNKTHKIEKSPGSTKSGSL